MLINTFLCNVDKIVNIILAIYLKLYYTSACTYSDYKISISLKILIAAANGNFLTLMCFGSVHVFFHVKEHTFNALLYELVFERNKTPNINTRHIG